MSRFADYIRATIAEMKRVKWPTQKQAVIYTALVVGVSIIVALLLAAFDYVFTGALNLIV